MRLVFVNNYLYFRGGAEKVLLDQKELFQKKGHQVSLFGQNHPDHPLDESEDWFPKWKDPNQAGILDGLPRFLRYVYSPQNRRIFSRFLEAVKPDLIHAHNLYGGLTMGILDAARDMGVPVVMTLHDYKMISPTPILLSGSDPCRACLERPGTFSCLLRRCHQGSFKKTFAFFWETWFNRRFRKYDPVGVFIAPSQFMKETVVRSGFDPARIHVVPNALDPKRYLPSERNEGYFLFAARMTDEKGMGVLLKAASRTSVEIVAAGEGAQLPIYQLRAGKKNGNVRFVGNQKPAQMEEHYRNCLAVVVPSLWHENASMTVLEALAHGKPVVASRMGGLPEQVEDGVNGFLFEPGDDEALGEILTRLAKDKELTQRIGRNARRVFEERYSHDLYYERLLKVYDKVLKKPNEPAN